MNEEGGATVNQNVLKDEWKLNDTATKQQTGCKLLKWRNSSQHSATVFLSVVFLFFLSVSNQFLLPCVFTPCTAAVWPAEVSRWKLWLRIQEFPRLVSKQACEWLVEEAAGKLDMLLNTMEDLSPLLLLALFVFFWLRFCFLVVVFCFFVFFSNTIAVHRHFCSIYWPSPNTVSWWALTHTHSRPPWKK